MSKSFQTETSIERAIQSGRGQGHGKDYTPWLEIHQVPSLGKSSRIKGWKTGRIHHLLSQLELQYMFLCDWRDDITDIREQYPLLPREEVQEICKGLGIQHPKDRRTGIDIVMTTDFVLTDTGGNTHARTIKQARELEAVRVIEKFEIERVYWERRNATWKIATENEINIDSAKSIEWVHSKYHLANMAPITGQDVAWEKPEGFVQCVNDTHEIECADCLLCAGKSKPAKSIWIGPHGAKKKRVL